MVEQRLGELTDQTVAVGKELVAARSAVAQIGPETAIPEDLLSVFSDNTQALAALRQDPQSTIETVDGYDIALHYGGEPVLQPGIARTVGLSVCRNDQPVNADARLAVPENWSVQPAPDAFGQKRFTLRANEVCQQNYLIVTVTVPEGELSAQYLVLSPEQVRGWPSNENVGHCPKCCARVECCICASS